MECSTVRGKAGLKAMDNMMVYEEQVQSLISQHMLHRRRHRSATLIEAVSIKSSTLLSAQKSKTHTVQCQDNTTAISVRNVLFLSTSLSTLGLLRLQSISYRIT